MSGVDARAPLPLLLGAALVLAGLGAVLVAGSFGGSPSVASPGRNAPVNEGARDLADIRSNNSPTVARNPRDADNVVVTNRIDSPRYSCALHRSFDGGA